MRELTLIGDNVTSEAYGKCDVTTSKVIHTFDHSGRVGALAWNGDLLASGSRDRLILQRNIRTPPSIPQRRLSGPRQEVCELKWSSDNQLLASGEHFNKLFVWGLHSVAPLQTFMEHIAAVKGNVINQDCFYNDLTFIIFSSHKGYITSH